MSRKGNENETRNSSLWRVGGTKEKQGTVLEEQRGHEQQFQRDKEEKVENSSPCWTLSKSAKFWQRASVLEDRRSLTNPRKELQKQTVWPWQLRLVAVGCHGGARQRTG